MPESIVHIPEGIEAGVEIIPPDQQDGDVFSVAVHEGGFGPREISGIGQSTDEQRAQIEASHRQQITTYRNGSNGTLRIVFGPAMLGKVESVVKSGRGQKHIFTRQDPGLDCEMDRCLIVDGRVNPDVTYLGEIGGVVEVNTYEGEKIIFRCE